MIFSVFVLTLECICKPSQEQKEEMKHKKAWKSKMTLHLAKDIINTKKCDDHVKLRRLRALILDNN